MAVGRREVLTRQARGAPHGGPSPAPVAAVAGALAVLLSLSGALRPADEAVYDQLATRIVAPPQTPGAILVAIDEPSMAELGPWPWPRGTHAALIRSLREAGARSIAFDIVFADPGEPEQDAALAAAIGPDIVLARDTELVEAPQGTLRAEVLPLPPLTAAGARTGAMGVPLDPDGTVRRLPAGADSLPSVIAGTLPPPAGARVSWSGPAGTYPRASYYQALAAGELLPPGFFAGADVLVGFALRADPDIVGAQDHFRTPWTARGGGLMPGVEVHANALDTLRHGRWILPAPAWATAVFGALLAGAAAYAVAGRPAGAALGIAAAAALLPLGVAAAGLAAGYWAPPAVPAAGALLAGIGQATRDYARERRVRRAVTDAFRHYLAPALVDRLARDPSALRLGGERRRVTVLFCDLRGFTALSEAMKDDPQALTALVNRALTPIADAILASGGAIDKFIGDCVMGLWNAPLDTPDHARRAVASGLAMVDAVTRLDAEIARERAEAGLPPLAIGCGVGINTGDCVVGNMGTASRFDYTAIGDAVNLAARLEGRTAVYGLAVLVGEETALEMAREPGAERLVAIDRVAVKGRTAPVELYTPASLLYGDEDCDRAAGLQTAALSAYRNGAWVRAAESWRQLAATAPSAARYATLMAGRAERFATDAPPPGWAGEWRFDEK